MTGPHTAFLRTPTTALRRLAAALLVASAATAPAGAQRIDTGTPPVANGSASPMGRSATTQYVSTAQTFTLAPSLGPVLQQFQFWLSEQVDFPTVQYRAYVYEWDAAARRPVGSYLWRSDARTGTGVLSPVLETFLTGGLTLTSGRTYAAILSSVEFEPDPFARALGGVRVSDVYTADAYPGGAAYVRFSPRASGLGGLTDAAWGTAGAITTGGDYAFTADFVAAQTPTTVPEPSAVALLGAGLLGVALGARARRRRAA